MEKIKRIVAIILLSMLIASMVVLPAYAMIANGTTTTSEADIPSEITLDRHGLPIAGVSLVLAESVETNMHAEIEENVTFITSSNYEYVETEDKAELETLIEECNKRMEAATEIIADATYLGYEDTNYVIVLANSEYETASSYLEIYQTKYDEIVAEELKWEQRKSEYPEATEIWLYMKSLGWNDYVCAGIMGNLMTETGGHTLALNVYDNHGNYYGMCQWNKGYNPNVVGADLTGQLDYVVETLPQEFASFGFLSGFTYNAFLEITDEKIAAKAFAKTYERCGASHVYVRTTDATNALEYFTGE